MTISSLLKILDNKYPFSVQEAWDKSGLFDSLHLEKIFNKTLITLDISLDVIDYAIENDCDLIVSHHPIYIDECDAKKTWFKKLKNKLDTFNISIISLHTNFDQNRFGMNYSLLKKLGLKKIKRLNRSIYAFKGVLQNKKTLEEVSLLIRKKFDCSELKFSSNYNFKHQVKTVAICGGSGSSEISKIQNKEKIDLFITSEIKWHLWANNLTKTILCELPHSLEKIFIEVIANFFVSQNINNFICYPLEKIKNLIVIK